MKTTIKNMSDALLVLDEAERVVDLNPAAQRLVGVQTGSTIGLPIAQVLPVWSTLAHDGAEPAAVYAAEISLSVASVGATGRAPPRQTRDFELQLSPVRRSDGELAGRVVLLHDITERKQAQEELQQAKDAAEAASQAKGAFQATVSHELRTPLTSVLGFAKLIKRRLGEVINPALTGAEPKVQRALKQVGDDIDIIVAEGERLTALINDVLDLAKIESGRVEWRMQPVAVSEVIERAVAATTSLSEQKGLALRTDIEAALPQVVGDADRLIQVVINLISNAVKFTATGSVTYCARRVRDAIEVRVSDTGIGIAPQDQDKVFE